MRFSTKIVTAAVENDMVVYMGYRFPLTEVTRISKKSNKFMLRLPPTHPLITGA